MSSGFVSPPHPDRPSGPSRLARILEPAEWAATGIPPLCRPRRVVQELYDLHHPTPVTAVIAVLGPQERLVASASFTPHAEAPDGWCFRNALLDQLRRVVPHDLRLRSPARTAVLMHCRNGETRWSDLDGAWMWGLRDACTLHGLRCGAYVVLTRAGWQVLGQEHGGRQPRAMTTTPARRPTVRGARPRRTTPGAHEPATG
ncbi:hypothetical protein [Streptomyces oceani]|uniref:Uncharacterized protein n=1 Tax=Streptomyces oceani TaxID=1075402 RepID=A0A1E7KLF8_9ACTN|nr:hypothetical protein [Streptomyces oceani]OEV04641.1 hypothetical protein AN216_07035 [Streptomyces oceani]